MRLEILENGNVVKVVLSRRNLRALISFAELGGCPSSFTAYFTAEGQLLIVKVEEDAEHYANPERDSTVPGEMHPETEEAM